MSSPSASMTQQKTPILEKTIITPVRRSTRKSCIRLPIALRDHDVIIESMDELEDRSSVAFRNNSALRNDQ